MTDRLEGAAWATLVVLSLAAGYEALVALEAIAIGQVPGEGPPGGDVVLVAGLLALLAAATTCVVAAALRRPARGLVWVLLAPAGAAYLVARWLAFDPYYAPSERRYSEGVVEAPWIAFVCVVALGAAALVARAPRSGPAAASASLLLTAFTVWVLPLGK